jgi:Ring finger domain
VGGCLFFGSKLFVKMQCPICLDMISEHTKYVTECQHSFHHTCMCQWTSCTMSPTIPSKQHTCPCCRAHIYIPVCWKQRISPSVQSSLLNRISSGFSFVNILSNMSISGFMWKFFFVTTILFQLVLYVSAICFYGILFVEFMSSL